MGSRLSGSSRLIAPLVGLALVVLSSSVPAQEDDDEVQRLYDSGLEAYRQKDYPAAIEALSRSYELEPRAATLFAWAQAERLNDNCEEAVVLYRRFLEKNASLEQSQLVRENLELCEKQLASDSPPDPTPSEPAVEPTPTFSPSPTPPVDRPGKTPVVQLGLIIVGAAGLGASGGLFIASRASRDGANAAERFEDHQRLNDRADTQQTLGLVVGAGSLALVVGGVVWALLANGDDESSSVSIAPADGGGVVVGISTPFL